MQQGSMNMYGGSMPMPLLNPMIGPGAQFGGNVSYNVPKYVLYVGNIGPKVNSFHADD